MLFGQKEEFDMYTVYCLKKTSAERCLDELGGDQNPFLQVSFIPVIIIIIIIITFHSREGCFCYHSRLLVYVLDNSQVVDIFRPNFHG